MNCPNCNAPLTSDDQFCANCGQPVPPPAPPIAAVSQPEKKRISGWAVIVVAVVIVGCCILAVGGGYLVFANRSQISMMTLPEEGMAEMEATISAQATQLAQDLEALDAVTPPTPPDLPQADVEDVPNLQDDSIKIWFDDALLQGASLVEVDPTPPGGYVPWDYAPMHLMIEIQKPKGEIHLVPVDAYVPMGEFSSGMIDELQLALENRPGVASWGCVPTWDFPCDHQEMNANVTYFDFQNGSGIRSVTVYAPQNDSAINNESMDYYFNGLTDDGLFYVYARFDLRHSALSEDEWNIPDDVYADIDMVGEKMKQYVIENAEMLESSPEGYSPPLPELDAVVQSLRVELEW